MLNALLNNGVTIASSLRLVKTPLSIGRQCHERYVRPKPARRTKNGYPEMVVAHSTRPLMGMNEYPRTYDPEGKVGSSCLQ
jgi:hypothetical protein